MKTPEQFKEQAEKLKITYWPSHDCSICGVSVGTEIHNGEPSYRSSCNCGSSPNHSHGWQKVADRYNMQTHPDIIKEMNEFWGFDN